MISGKRSLLQRAIDVCSRALGGHGEQDAIVELERATSEMRDQVERLRREATPRCRPVRRTSHREQRDTN
jgi:hypothetical protein